MTTRGRGLFGFLTATSWLLYYSETNPNIFKFLWKNLQPLDLQEQDRFRNIASKIGWLDSRNAEIFVHDRNDVSFIGTKKRVIIIFPKTFYTSPLLSDQNLNGNSTQISLESKKERKNSRSENRFSITLF